MKLWTFFENKNSRVFHANQSWHHSHLKTHQFNIQFILSYQIMIVNIKSIQYKIAFNKKSILHTVNYMIIRKMTMLISNTHNITPNMVSYLQTYVLKISSIELILWSIRLNFESKNYLWTKIEPKRKYKWLPAKRSEGAEGVLAELREA